jgi:cytochrome c oxidase assembly factor CtaG/putative copper export protein
VSASVSTGPHRQRRRPAGLAAAAAAAGLAVLALALAYGGGASTAPLPGLPSAGAVTGWGLPVARLLVDVAGIGTVGALLAVGLLLPAPPGGLPDRSALLLRTAAAAAGGWAVAAATSIVLTFSDFVGGGLADSLRAAPLRSFVTQTAQGKALALQAVVAAAVAIGATTVARRPGVLALLVLALTGIVLPGLSGHSGAANDHMLAVSSLVVHVVAASLWIGGLLALVVLGMAAPTVRRVAVTRFSHLALWCLVAVAFSGIVNAALRLGSVGELTGSSYGRLVLGKLAALAALAAFGWAHRRRTLPHLDDAAVGRCTSFARVAATEIVVMVATVGLAVGLSRTPTPVPRTGPAQALTRTQELLGYPMPPPPTPWRLLADVHLDGFVLTGAVLAAALYLTGQHVLRQRGNTWPPGRTVSWLAGIGILVLVTSGGVGRYAPVLFSVHMFQHMVLNMVVPILLVLGAPMTLALRTLTPAARGGIGAREILLAVLHSRVVRVFSHPLVAAAIFVGSLYGLYFSPIFPAAMANHWGHLAMQVHFLAAGSLFFWVLIGIDPAPRRPPHIARLVLMLGVMVIHAFFSVALLSANSVLAPAWYGALQRPWGSSLLDDQHLGGGIGWAFGELPIAAVLAALIVSWVRSDAREAARVDRRADADGGAELAAHNARFAALAGRDGESSTRGGQPPARSDS